MAVAIIPAYVDLDGEENGKRMWMAQTVTGLFARGEGFMGARQALANLIIETDQAKTEAVAFEAEHENDEDITAIRIMATTRKTFPVT